MNDRILKIEIRADENLFHYNDGSICSMTLIQGAEELKKCGADIIKVVTNYDEKRDNPTFYLTKARRLARDAGYTGEVTVKTFWSGGEAWGFYYDEINGNLYKDRSK